MSQRHKTILEILEGIAHSYGCEIQCQYERNDSFAHCKRSLIILNLWHMDSVDYVASTFFHELSHIICYREGYFPIYHRSTTRDLKNKKTLAAYLRTAVRAELFVDKMGKNLCKEFLPKIKYRSAYKSKESRKYLMKEARKDLGMRL